MVEPRVLWTTQPVFFRDKNSGVSECSSYIIIQGLPAPMCTLSFAECFLQNELGPQVRQRGVGNRQVPCDQSPPDRQGWLVIWSSMRND